MGKVKHLLARYTDSAVDSTGSSSHQWLRLLGTGYLLSCMSHLCIVGGDWLILQALGMDVPLGAVVWLVLAIPFALLIPISVGGLGVNEAVYVAVLGTYGLGVTEAFGAALLSRALGMLFAVLGGLAWMIQKRERADWQVETSAGR